MFTQQAMIKMMKNKKGISIMIGYILLISIAIIISIFVYQWVSTYIPRGSLECSDGVSLFVESYNYNCDTNQFTLNLENNGRFDVAGYFIHATTNPSQELAVQDLSFTANDETHKAQGSIIYPPAGGDFNRIGPGGGLDDLFDLTLISECGTPDGSECIYSLEIIPIRYEVVENKNYPASCSEAKITEPLSCTVEEAGEECGNDVTEGSEVCDGTDLNGETCSSQGYDGGTLDCQSTCDAYDFSQCTGSGPVCGDDVLEGSEECEPGLDTSGECIAAGQPNECTCNEGFVGDGSGECEAETTELADLTIRSSPLPTVTRSNVGGGADDLTIDFRVENIGTADAAESEWEVSDSATPATNDPQTGNAPSIAASSFYDQNGVVLNYGSRFDSGTITITADNTGLITESDETNNVLSVDIDCTGLGNNEGGACIVSITP